MAPGVRDWAVTSAAGPSASMLPWVAGHLVSFSIQGHLYIKLWLADRSLCIIDVEA